MAFDNSRLQRHVLAVVGEPGAVLLTSSTWVHRRKETVDLIDEDWIRRQTTIDFTIPGDLTPSYSGLMAGDFRSRYLIPLTLLPKMGPSLMRFDLSDETGDAHALPTRYQCQLAAYAALQWAALTALGDEPNDSGAALPGVLRSELLMIATADAESASGVARSLAMGQAPEARQVAPQELEAADEALESWSRALTRDTVSLVGQRGAPLSLTGKDREALAAEETPFPFLVELLARSSLVMIETTGGGDARKRLRMGYEQFIFKDPKPSLPERRLALSGRFGWQPQTLALVMPYARAHTYHLEVEAPPALEINDSRLLVRRDDEARLHCHVDDVDAPRFGSRIHRYIPDAGGVQDVTLHLELRANRRGFVGTAWLAATAVAAVLALIAAFPQTVLRAPTNVPSFLIVFPALFVTLTAIPDRGSLVVRILQLARRTLLFSGVLAYSGAAAFLLMKSGRDAVHPSTLVRVYWIALAVAAIFAAVALLLARMLPRPWPDACPAVVPHPERRLERWLAWFEWLPTRLALRGLRLRVEIPGLDAEELRVLGDVPSAAGVAVRVRRQRWRGGGKPRVVELATHFNGRPLLYQAPAGPGERLPLNREGALALASTVRDIVDRVAGPFELTAVWRRGPADHELVRLRRRARLVALVSGDEGRSELRLAVRYVVRSRDEDAQEAR